MHPNQWFVSFEGRTWSLYIPLVPITLCIWEVLPSMISSSIRILRGEWKDRRCYVRLWSREWRVATRSRQILCCDILIRWEIDFDILRSVHWLPYILFYVDSGPGTQTLAKLGPFMFDWQIVSLLNLCNTENQTWLDIHWHMCLTYSTMSIIWLISYCFGVQNNLVAYPWFLVRSASDPDRRLASAPISSEQHPAMAINFGK